MLILRRGDRLPTVAVVQSYLNHGPAAEPVAVDGVFGPDTETAVKRFQEGRQVPQTGVVDYALWSALVGTQWQVLDSVDRTDHADPGHRILDHEDLAPFGQTVLQQFGMSGGGALVLDSVMGAARMGAVVLLRFHGHGSPGTMVVASGRTADSAFSSRLGTGFDRALRRLRPIFARFGSIEFHGCRVGLGHMGRDLLSRVADATGVPASAA